MCSNKVKASFSYLLTFIITLSLLCMTAFAAAQTVEVLDGKVSVTDSEGTGTSSGGTVTITAKGSLFSKKTNTVTITNKTDKLARLGFDYSVSSANSFTIADATASASGSYSGMFDAGASVTIKVTSNSGLNNTTATLTLRNFSLTEVAASSNITFNYDSSLGSVTVGGEAVESGAEKNVSPTEGAALVATAKSGAMFHGWIEEANGKILSESASYTYQPSEDTTIKAVFTGTNSTPHFGVGSAAQKSVSSGLLGLGKLYYHEVGISYIFDDLNEAAAFASTSATNKAVVLLNSGTLSAGTYTIPSGVTLLIPFDAANSLYTTQVINTGTYTIPTKYRTLTMADGADLVINGSMSLSAKQRYAKGNKTDGGSPTGACSFVQMQGNSSITVNNGGTLYAYGFITGSGSVTAKNGATIYECFQIMDFRGGTQSTDMDHGVFPLSQYYIQNIEVPMTLEYGAKEYAYTTIYMSKADFGSSINFIGPSNAMFILTKGSVTKRYDGARDRLMIELNGDLMISNVSLSVGTSSIDSKDYDLPINGNLSVTAKFGSTVQVGQDLVFLPGSEFVIEDGATCTLNSGCNVFIYDAAEWGTFCGASNKPFIPLSYAPGKTYTRTNDDMKSSFIQVDGTVDASTGYAYTTKTGANIHSTGTGVVKINPGTQKMTHQLVQNTGYTEIPITSAQLKNGDGSYVGTNAKADTYTYCPGCVRWISGVEGIVSHVVTSGVIDHAATWADAISKYDTPENGKFIQLIKDCAVTGTFVNGTVLDVNGHSASNVNVNGSLYGMDSKTDGYVIGEGDDAPGSIIVSGGTVAPVTEFSGKNTTEGQYNVNLHRYLAVNTAENTCEFHRFNISVTDYYVEAYTDGTAYVGFGATLHGDSKVSSALTNIGFLINDEEIWAVDWNNNGFTNGTYKFNHTVQTNVNQNTAAALVKFGAYSFTSDSESIAIGNAINSFAAEDGTNAAAAKAAILAIWPVIESNE